LLAVGFLLLVDVHERIILELIELLALRQQLLLDSLLAAFICGQMAMIDLLDELRVQRLVIAVLLDGLVVLLECISSLALRAVIGSLGLEVGPLGRIVCLDLLFELAVSGGRGLLRRDLGGLGGSGGGLSGLELLLSGIHRLLSSLHLSLGSRGGSLRLCVVVLGLCLGVGGTLQRDLGILSSLHDAHESCPAFVVRVDARRVVNTLHDAVTDRVLVEVERRLLLGAFLVAYLHVARHGGSRGLDALVAIKAEVHAPAVAVQALSVDTLDADLVAGVRDLEPVRVGVAAGPVRLVDLLGAGVAGAAGHALGAALALAADGEALLGALVALALSFLDGVADRRDNGSESRLRITVLGKRSLVGLVRLVLRATGALEASLGMEVLLLDRLECLQGMLGCLIPLRVDPRVLAELGLRRGSSRCGLVNELLCGIEGCLGGAQLLGRSFLGSLGLGMVALGGILRLRSSLEGGFGSGSSLHEGDELGLAFLVGRDTLSIQCANILLVRDGILARAELDVLLYADIFTCLHLARHLRNDDSRWNGGRGVSVRDVSVRVVAVMAVVVVMVVVTMSPLCAGDVLFGAHHGDGQEEAECENNLRHWLLAM